MDLVVLSINSLLSILINLKVLSCLSGFYSEKKQKTFFSILKYN